MWNKRARSKAQGGFTLIEIMVVVVIIGLLATMILPRVLGRQDEAFIAKAKSDIRALSSAVKLYKLDNFKYPSTSDGLNVLATSGKDNRGYIERLPKDPWGNNYQYLYPGEKMEFDIWSFGADGQAGGGDAGVDIGNWNMDEIK
ncbi:MAG: type II secretion system major pseudopilin GspG [Pseudomonadota bacterium]|nr:type II secretion system major pseudopilin GspG [Pseudomonadota bacterium]